VRPQKVGFANGAGTSQPILLQLSRPFFQPPGTQQRKAADNQSDGPGSKMP
jgi:hypothetical protein